MCTCSSVSTALFQPVSVYLSLNQSLFLCVSLVLFLGMHLCLSTYVRCLYSSSISFCRSLYMSLSLCPFWHFFLIVSPSFCMPPSFKFVSSFHSPPALPSGFLLLFLSSSVSVQVCIPTPSQCPALSPVSFLASLSIPDDLSLPLSISLFLSHSPSPSVTWVPERPRFEP